MSAAPAATGGCSARAAVAITAMLALLCGGLVFVATDRPLLAAVDRQGRAERGALAVRDHVPAFQQWGTRAFTMPALRRAYGEVEYLTLTDAAVDWQAAFVERLEHLLRSHASVDVFLLAHSNNFVTWTEAIAPELRQHLRLVYNTGCFDLRQKEAWLALGARSYVAHVGQSESPIFYVFFLRRWLRGGRLGGITADCNERTERVMAWTGPGLQSNARASAASTHAELVGDAQLTIGSGGR